MSLSSVLHLVPPVSATITTLVITVLSYRQRTGGGESGLWKDDHRSTDKDDIPGGHQAHSLSRVKTLGQVIYKADFALTG